MLKKNAILLAKIIPIFIVMLFAMRGVKKSYPLPYPHFGELMLKRGEMRDLLGIVLGLRGSTADIAWIDLVQYIGGGILPDEDPNRNFDLMKYFSLRVIRIDPYFRKAVLYGANILAWFHNVNRPEEALELLYEAQIKDPDYWPYKAVIAAILYKNDKLDQKAIEILESAVKIKDCPLMIKNILANIYKKEGSYQKAFKVWDNVYSTGDSFQKQYALQQLEILRLLIVKDKRNL